MATKSRKSMSGAVQGMDAFFPEPEEEARTQPKVEVTPEEELERVTLYIRPDQDALLTQLRAQLKRKRVKTSRSELVRVALNILGEQELEYIEKQLQGV
jgi:hypothetical protein